MENVNLDFLTNEGKMKPWKAKECFRLYRSLMAALRAEKGSDEYLPPELFEDEAKQFVKHMRGVFFDEDVTPYMHALAYHVPHFLRLYGTIHQFNCQPVEKKNHTQNSSFHRSTQHGGFGSSYCKQVLQEENRALYQRREGLLEALKPKKRTTKRRETEKSRAWRETMQQRAKEKRLKLAKRMADQLKKKAKKRALNKKIKVKPV